MKKIIKYILVLVLTLLFIPNVYAANNVEITDINLVDQSVDLIEVSPPKIDGMNLKFDLSFLNVGDYAKYKVEITNNSNKDFYLDNETKFSNSNYLSYKYELPDKINKIEKNSKISMYITIKYEKAVPEERLVNGIYTEENSMSIDLADVILKNPNTYSNIIILFIVFISLIIFTIIRINKKKKLCLNILIIGLILIPLSVYALERITIKAETKITIEKERNIIESRYIDNNFSIERDFWSYTNYIKSITFKTSIEEPRNYAYKFDVSEKKNNSIIAYLVPNEENNTYFDLYIMSNGYIYANPDSSYFFYTFNYLNKINNLELYKTNYATNMEAIFSYLPYIEKIDITSFNTENVTNMSRMFQQGSGGSGGTNVLIEVKLGNIDTSKVTDMSSMFSGCENLTSIDLSPLDTSKVTKMNNMFAMCRVLKNIDLSTFNTSQVTDMSYMFDSCETITNLDLTTFDTSKVTNMQAMFTYCSNLMRIDLSSFDTNNVTNMSMMFMNSSELEEIYVGDKWTVENVTNSTKMFLDCIALRNFNSSSTDKTNANTSDTGYLLKKGESYISR